MVLLPNKLAQWMLRPQGADAAAVRPFSHVADNPKDVPQWSMVHLQELGAAVAFDRRTCVLMHDHDVDFYVARKRSQPFLHAVRIEPGPRARRAVARPFVGGVMRAAVARVVAAL